MPVSERHLKKAQRFNVGLGGTKGKSPEGTAELVYRQLRDTTLAEHSDRSLMQPLIRRPSPLKPLGRVLEFGTIMKAACSALIGLVLLNPFIATRAADSALPPEPLAGTEILTLQGDIASNLVAGVDSFLLRELEQSEARREHYWKRDWSSPTAYTASVATNRARLAHILGVRDKRERFSAPELLATTAQSAVIATAEGYDVLAIRWPALNGVHGEGLLLAPHAGRGLAQVVAVPDATQTPEQLAGLTPGLPEEAQYARRLAENGCRVVIPTIISRDRGPHKGRSKLTAREFLYRPAFELGRHLIGYEVQKVLALVDWLESEAGPEARIGVIGWGDGGMLALYAGALDPRIQAVCVSGYFGDRRGIWEQPIDRNVFGLLDQFGDAELASLVHPHRVIVEAAKAPEVEYSGEGGGAPAEVVTPPLAEVRREVERAQRLCRSEGAEATVQLVLSGDGTGPAGSAAAVEKFLAALQPGVTLSKPVQALTAAGAPLPDAAARQARQLQEIDEYTQRLLVDSPYVRADFMKGLDTSSLRSTGQPWSPTASSSPTRSSGASTSRCSRPRSVRAKPTMSPSGPATKWSWTCFRT